MVSRLYTNHAVWCLVGLENALLLGINKMLFPHSCNTYIFVIFSFRIFIYAWNSFFFILTHLEISIGIIFPKSPMYLFRVVEMIETTRAVWRSQDDRTVHWIEDGSQLVPVMLFPKTDKKGGGGNVGAKILHDL